jgi:segregation and condensation protein A
MDAIAADSHGPEEGEGASPLLTLDGFTGPLAHLLALARARKIDLSQLSLTALVDQLAVALREAPVTTSLSQKGDWVVMAAWLVQLRARLLLPADAPGQQEAAAEADALRSRLVGLEAVQALAAWLERRPLLGHDVFARGRPEVFGVSVEAAQAIDVIEFLWASMALFDDTPAPDTATVYQPRPLELYTVAEARDRILRLLEQVP